MKITFIRHAAVQFKWKLFYDSSGFDTACKAYDDAQVKESGNVQTAMDLIYISSMKRSADTAKTILISTTEPIKTDLLNEIPLCAFIATTLKLPTLVWMIAGRLQWYFNHPKQVEGRKATQQRISSFLDQLSKAQQDCTIIGHGFYFVQMLEEIKRRGYTGSQKKRIRNEESRVFILNQG